MESYYSKYISIIIELLLVTQLYKLDFLILLHSLKAKFYPTII